MFTEVKDSGVREEFGTGMVRDTQDGKPRFDLLLPEGVPFSAQFLTRCAQHLANGAKKYSARNWEQARTEAELARYKSSALRHLVQWLSGETDEDHAAAVFFNLMGAEFVKYHLAQDAADDSDPYEVGKLALDLEGEPMTRCTRCGIPRGTLRHALACSAGNCTDPDARPAVQGRSFGYRRGE